MSKDTFYFPHDYNARADRKLVNVLMKHGVSGIGVYWCIVEMLYEEGGYLPLEYERITFELRSSDEVIQSIINDFDLFKHDDAKFWSESIIERLQERCAKSAKARDSINKRWNKTEKNTNVLHSNTERNTIKESKVKESKEEKENIKEIVLKVKHLFDEKYLNDSAYKTLNVISKNYSDDEIIKAIVFGRTDAFWKTNFLSLNKLVKKNKDNVSYMDVFLEKSKYMSKDLFNLNVTPECDLTYEIEEKRIIDSDMHYNDKKYEITMLKSKYNRL